MSTNSTRRFTLLDALALVGGAAVGLALSRSMIVGSELEDYIRRSLFDLTPGGWTAAKTLERLLVLVLLLAPYLTGLSLAHCVLYLFPPRTSWTKVRLEVGFLTSVLVLCAALASASLMHAHAWASGRGPIRPELLAISWAAGAVPWSVAAGWFVLALSGHWRSERTWLDRLGRILGWAWIISLPLSAAVTVIG